MSDTIQHISRDVIKTWIEDENYFLYSLTDTRRETVDTYIDALMHDFALWDKSQPLYMIHDISDKNVALTPYLRGRLTELTNHVKTEQIHFVLALVIENNFAGQVMRSFGRLLSTRTLTMNFFTDIHQAHQWMKKQQAKAS